MYACVRVFGVRWLDLVVSCEGIGCVIREWREEERLGTMSEWDAAPWLLVGRSLCSRSRVSGRVRKEPVSPSLREGAMTQGVVTMHCSV